MGYFINHNLFKGFHSNKEFNPNILKYLRGLNCSNYYLNIVKINPAIHIFLLVISNVLNYPFKGLG